MKTLLLSRAAALSVAALQWQAPVARRLLDISTNRPPFPPAASPLGGQLSPLDSSHFLAQLQLQTNSCPLPPGLGQLRPTDAPSSGVLVGRLFWRVSMRPGDCWFFQQTWSLAAHVCSSSTNRAQLLHSCPALAPPSAAPQPRLLQQTLFPSGRNSSHSQPNPIHWS